MATFKMAKGALEHALLCPISTSGMSKDTSRSTLIFTGIHLGDTGTTIKRFLEPGIQTAFSTTTSQTIPTSLSKAIQSQQSFVQTTCESVRGVVSGQALCLERVDQLELHICIIHEQDHCSQSALLSVLEPSHAASCLRFFSCSPHRISSAAREPY